jgi:hypothetical protein
MSCQQYSSLSPPAPVRLDLLALTRLGPKNSLAHCRKDWNESDLLAIT